MNKHMKELDKLTHEQLRAKSTELKSEIVDVNKSIKLGNTQNYHSARMMRKQLARMQTLLAQPEKVTIKKDVKEAKATKPKKAEKK